MTNDDLAQCAWDTCEAIDGHLDNLTGLERPLFDLLDEGLAGAPLTVSQGVYALIRATRHFRMEIAREAEALRRQAQG